MHELEYGCRGTERFATPLAFLVTRSELLAKKIREELPCIGRAIRKNALRRFTQKPSELDDPVPAPIALPKYLYEYHQATGTHSMTYLEFLKILDASLGDGEYYFASADDGEWVGRTFFLADRAKIRPAKINDSQTAPASSNAVLPDQREIDYERFCDEYWPTLQRIHPTEFHFSFDIFKEILLVKAGRHDPALHGGSVVLEEADYVERPPKESSARYDEKQRKKLYELFVKYEAMRREKRDWDVSDAVNQIHTR